MILEKVKTPGLAQIGYVLGNLSEAVVIDPRRDVEPYLQAAAKHQLAIRYIIETHRQEDYVMGSAELSRLTGAKIVNGTHELFGHGDIHLADGKELRIAKMRLVAIHTPGHTPESVSYALYLDEIPDRAIGVFTGDALFIGETGRTDLPDPLATGHNAGLLYDAIHAKLLPLGDQALILPAHGSGSVCGGKIADRDESTMGLERLSNPVFKQTRAEFIASKLEERIPRPPYFSRMEELNTRGGKPLPAAWLATNALPPADFRNKIESGIVIDTRGPEAFASGHIPGAYSIGLKGLSVFAGWICSDATLVYLVLDQPSDLEQAVLALHRVGLDSVGGVLAGGFEAWRDAGFDIAQAPATTPSNLDLRGATRVLDVRDDTEFEEGHHPNATHAYVGYVEKFVDRIVPALSPDEPLVVTCSVGHRASLAVSMLHRLGFPLASNLLGGMKGWKRRGGAIETDATANTLTTLDVEGPRR